MTEDQKNLVDTQKSLFDSFGPMLKKAEPSQAPKNCLTKSPIQLETQKTDSLSP